MADSRRETRKISALYFPTKGRAPGYHGKLELSDDEEKTDGGNGQDDNDGLKGQPQEGLTKSKRFSPDSGLRRSSQLAQRCRASNAQQKTQSSHDSDLYKDDFFAALLKNEKEDAFCTVVLAREVTSEGRRIKKRRPLPRETVPRSPRTVRARTLSATARMTLPGATVARCPKASTGRGQGGLY